MTRWLFFAPVFLFVIIAGGLWLGLGQDPSVLPSALINQPAPRFSLAAVRSDDRGFTNEDIEGEVVLVNVFASWCGPCHLEHPTLMEIAQSGRIRIYGINWKESPEEGRLFLQQAGDPYERVGSDESGRLALDFGVTGAPETFVIDRHGYIRFKQVGPITPEVWRDTIEPIVSQLEGGS